MMPFILSADFEESKLPKYLKPYWPFIQHCSRVELEKTRSDRWLWFRKETSEIGKVCYLTVQESFVEENQTQRRPGLHVDCPGYVKVREAPIVEGGEGSGGGRAERREGAGNKIGKRAAEDEGGSAPSGHFSKGSGMSKRFTAHHWGLGGCHFVPYVVEEDDDDDGDFSGSRDPLARSFELRGGIYMASSVENSCRAWNCKIVPEEEDDHGAGGNNVADDNSGGRRKGNNEAIGRLGSIEHLRHLLPEELALTMKANCLYWMTDRTPHESLPLKRGTHRQFFRLVMSQVSLWYEDHSTPNPNGVEPDPKITKIVKGDKFSPEGVIVVP